LCAQERKYGGAAITNNTFYFYARGFSLNTYTQIPI
jgi:hypothetical protein